MAVIADDLGFWEKADEVKRRLIQALRFCLLGPDAEDTRIICDLVCLLGDLLGGRLHLLIISFFLFLVRDHWSKIPPDVVVTIGQHAKASIEALAAPEEACELLECLCLSDRESFAKEIAPGIEQGFEELLRAESPDARAYGFWLIGRLGSCGSPVLTRQIWKFLPKIPWRGDEAIVRVEVAKMIENLIKTDVKDCHFPRWFFDVGALKMLGDWLKEGDFEVKEAVLEPLSAGFIGLSRDEAIMMVRTGFVARMAGVYGAIVNPRWVPMAIADALVWVSEMPAEERVAVVAEIAESGIIEEVIKVDEEIGDDYDSDVVEEIVSLWEALERQVMGR
jgi:hypothetical protein